MSHTARAGRAVAIVMTLAVIAAGCGQTADDPAAPKPSGQRTAVRTYSPFERDGSVRQELTVTGSEDAAQCSSGSYIVASAYRCFIGDEIRDVCYLDRRDASLPAMVCVDSPWATRAARASYSQDPDHSGGAKRGGPPWALELTRRGRRCTFTSGATTTIRNYRLNYTCAGNPPLEPELYLFGDPDTSRPLWRIRASTTPDGPDVKWVQIRRAWR
ncbi:MAG: hypothetical protein M3401_06010 [Actinomycetota bacterium]|nr:hypothetical protein [Actinomycetota bacterium]